MDAPQPKENTDTAATQTPTAEQNTEVAQVQQQQVTENTPVLQSATFDLGKSSVFIYDDTNNPGLAVVEYEGVQYPYIASTEFEFVGSSKTNTVTVMTDREYNIFLKDLNLSADIPIAFGGKGKFHNVMSEIFQQFTGISVSAYFCDLSTYFAYSIGKTEVFCIDI